MTNQNNQWLDMPNLVLNTDIYDHSSLNADAIVIGAGIAGASAAYHLAKAGLKVWVLDKAANSATAGSGNRQGMLYMKLSPHTPLENELALAGFQYTLQLLKQLTEKGLLEKGKDWDNCGLLQLAYASKRPEYQTMLAEQYSEIMQFVDSPTASELAGISLRSGGLLFPESGWVAPQSFTKALLQHSNITFLSNQTVVDIQSVAEDLDLPLWQVKTAAQTYQSKIVVLAMASGVCELKVCEHLPIISARGQTTSLKQENLLKMVVSGEGYIAPSIEQNGDCWTTFGATFERHGEVSAPTGKEHRENIAMLEQNSERLAANLGLNAIMSKLPETLEGRVALRASAPGSLPIVGPIAQYDEFMARFASIRLDAKRIPEAKVPWEYGLYLSTAHGARGMITAPLAGKMLINMILPRKSIEEDINGRRSFRLTEAMYRALHPNRFYYQQLRSGKSLD